MSKPNELLRNIIDHRSSVEDILPKDLEELKKDRNVRDQLDILFNASMLEVPFSKSDENNWEDIERRIAAGKKSSHRKLWLPMAASISIIFVFASYFIF
ncbi:MAG: hypothetical protein O2887_17385 [Bacteroidetes bacterium]|nr:hypothetical protein [Bacteroidota bacterium]MDA1122231.1 hypothetical protein [Bacteroidota bacterium]